MKSQQEMIEKFLKLKSFAVYGFSRNNKKFGNVVYNELRTKGLKVFGINPNAESIGEEKCYKDLNSLPGPIEGAIFVTKPEVTLFMLNEIIKQNIKYVWIQQGAGNKEVYEFCKNNSINFVSGKCILMFVNPVKSIHGFHRFMSKAFGLLYK